MLMVTKANNMTINLDKYCISASYPNLVKKPLLGSWEHNNLIRLDNIISQIETEYDIIITSAYRNDELNKAVGGKPTSFHKYGLAVDFVSGDKHIPLKEIFEWVKDNVEYDKLLLEGGSWIHMQIARQDSHPRKIALFTDKNGRAT